MNSEAEFIIYRVSDESGRQRVEKLSGREVGRVTVSTHKWGPSNAIQKYVRENHPPEGVYLVAGDQDQATQDNPAYANGPGRFNTYEVRYPQYAIEGTGAGGWQLYGNQATA